MKMTNLSSNESDHRNAHRSGAEISISELSQHLGGLQEVSESIIQTNSIFHSHSHAISFRDLEGKTKPVESTQVWDGSQPVRLEKNKQTRKDAPVFASLFEACCRARASGDEDCLWAVAGG